MTTRYAIYTRQSVARAGDILSSCQTQFTICQDFVAARAGQDWAWIGERFDDEGRSGSTTERPALQRLIGRIEAGEIHKLVIYRLDRLARSLRHTLALIDLLRSHQVELLIFNAPALGGGSSEAFTLNIMAAMAELELDLIRSRLADSRSARKRQGMRLAGAIPYGYTADPRTKQLIVESTEAQRVEAVFQMAADGMPPTAIAAQLNALSWGTKRHVARITNHVSGGGPWTPRQVLEMLNNPVYLGLFRDGSGSRRGNHRPIVPRATFDQVQERLAERRTPKRRSQVQAVMAWPLRGRIRCPGCGRHMSPHQTCEGPKIYRHYRCRSHAGGRPPCTGSALPAAEVEARVVEILLAPDLIDEVSIDMREVLVRFQERWLDLDSITRLRLLPYVIDGVHFNPKSSVFRIQINPSGLSAEL